MKFKQYIVWLSSLWLVYLSGVESNSCPEKNVAEGKIAVQSSTLSEENSASYSANLAIDGNRSTSSQTSSGYVQWWYADMVTPQNIARIDVIICDICDEKYYLGNDYLVFTGVTRTSLNLIASRIQTKTSSFSIKLPNEPLVRFVEIQRYERSNVRYPLALAEVEVFRKPFSPDESSVLPFKPSFTSSWQKVTPDKSQIVINHNLNDWPIRVAAEVQVKHGSDVMVFNGHGFGINAGNSSSAYGGLTTVYNDNEVFILMPAFSNEMSLHKAWSGPDIGYSQVQVRVKVWSSSDFPIPILTSAWVQAEDSKQFIEISHPFCEYPDLVVIQLNTTLNTKEFYIEGPGVMPFSNYSSNGLTFGYNKDAVRIWMHAGFDKAFSNLLVDNLEANTSAQPVFVRVLIWKLFPDPLIDIQLDPKTTDFSQPRQLPFDIKVDEFLVFVEMEVKGGGNNAGYRFHGVDTSLYSSTDDSRIGGLIYAVTSKTVLLWQPISGHFVSIEESLGAGSYSQMTNAVSIRLAFFRLYTYDDVRCNISDSTFPYYHGSETIFAYKKEIISHCPIGKMLKSGNLSRMCSRNCSWEGNPATCTDVTCPTQGIEVNNSHFSLSGSLMGDILQYNCNTGYANTSGDLTRTCLSNGKWSGTEPVCSEIFCPLEGIAVNSSTFNISGNKLFDNIVYKCEFGYSHSSGDLNRTCLQDGQWSGQAPVCAVIPCFNNTSNSSNLSYSVEGVLPGDRIIVACNKWHKLSAGSNIRTCQLGGQWDGLDPICSEILCDHEDFDVPNATHIKTGYRPGDNVTYYCNSGYKHGGGNLTRICEENGDWTGTRPVCKEIVCDNGDLDIPNTTHITTGHRPGDNVTYRCTSGYKHGGGNLTRMCQETGDWTGIAPVCGEIVCDQEDLNVPNTTHITTGHRPGDNVTYRCTSGYKHGGGNLTRICQGYGDWTVGKPVCFEIVCDHEDLGVPNTTHITTGHRPGDNVTYRCTTGYKHGGGNLTRICQESGDWTGTRPVCYEIVCDKEDLDVPNTTHITTGHRPGDNVTYGCITGYKHGGGNLTRICQENGDWTGRSPECKEIVCDHEDLDVPNTTHITTGNRPGDNVTYRCTSGYKHGGGNLTRMCQENGHWTGRRPICKEIVCDHEDLDVPNTTHITTGHRPGDNVTYRCTSGYKHGGGNLTIICQGSGDWTGTRPVCSEIVCDQEDLDVPNTTHITTGHRPGDNVTYRCTSGYKHGGGNLTRMCQGNGDWTGRIPICREIVCDNEDLDVPNTTHITTGYRPGDNVTYRCTSGYKHGGGNLTRICQENGHWTGGRPICSEIVCDNDDLDVPNTTHITTGHRPGDNVTYRCTSGYKHGGGNLTRICQENGEWTGRIPTCKEITCSVDENTVLNASYSTTGNKVNDIISYACGIGFRHINGNLTRTCQTNGLWSGVPPQCIEVLCATPELNVSNAEHVITGNRHGDKITYKCLDGFSADISNLTRICQEDGTWSGQTPVCKVTECPLDEVNTSSFLINITGNKYEDNAVFRCPSSMRVRHGSLTRVCQNDSTWSGSQVVCESCYCPCVHETEEEVAEEMKKTAEQLIRKKSTLSRTIREKTSARDDRGSAQAIGCIGIIMFLLILAILIIPDIPSLREDLSKGYGNLKMVYKGAAPPSVRQASGVGIECSNITEMEFRPTFPFSEEWDNGDCDDFRSVDFHYYEHEDTPDSTVSDSSETVRFVPNMEYDNQDV